MPSPTNMEGTVLAWLALRIYNAYRHNRALPAGTWSQGLHFGGAGYGYVSGKVTDGTDPISGATVILVDGDQSANSQDLTAYIDIATTGEDGSWSLRFYATGAKTVYAVKPGYKDIHKTYNFQQPDQNIVFPDAALVVA